MTSPDPTLPDAPIPSPTELVDKLDNATFKLIDSLDDLMEASQTRDAVNVSSAISNLAAARARLQEAATSGSGNAGGDESLVGLANRLFGRFPEAVAKAGGVIPETK